MLLRRLRNTGINKINTMKSSSKGVYDKTAASNNAKTVGAVPSKAGAMKALGKMKKDGMVGKKKK
jgi:hypothetical protein